MKTKLTILKLLIVLCSASTTTAVFAQPFIQTLTNTLAATYPGVPLNGTTNFNGNNGFAAPGDTVLVSGSIATFDGTVPGTIYMYQLGNLAFGPGGAVGGGFGSVGFSIDLTPSQTSPVNFFADTNQVSPPNFGFNSIQVQGPGGQLILGDNSTRQLTPVLRPAGSNHIWMNNSTNPVVIHPNVQILNGGGAVGHVINFQGTGDFHITNALRFFQSGPTATLQWDSTGTTIWASDGGNGVVPSTNRFDTPQGPIVINAGTVIVQNAGLLPLSFVATTTISNGTLIVNADNTGRPIVVNGGTLGGTGIVGQVTIQSGGTLAPGTSVGTLTINSNLTIGGNLVIEVNKSLAQSNDLVVVSGVLTNTGAGTLTVSNFGPALVVGDKFTLFNKPVQNGGALNVSGPAGVSWANHLADDGSISVLSVPVTTPPTLNFTNNGDSLQFTWDTSFGNYKLQSQTNSLNVGISTNWGDYPGGSTSGVTVPIDATNATVFFRLVSP